MRKGHGHEALRRGRVDIPGQIYIVTTVASNRTRFFADFDMASCAARTLSEEDVWLDARLLCWVLMPDHWHGLVELGDAASLSSVVMRMKSLTARAVNARFHRHGALWDPSFHDRALRHEDSVETTARYIIENPVRARLVEDVADYSFWNAYWIDDYEIL